MICHECEVSGEGPDCWLCEQPMRAGSLQPIVTAPPVVVVPRISILPTVSLRRAR